MFRRGGGGVGEGGDGFKGGFSELFYKIGLVVSNIDLVIVG